MKISLSLVHNNVHQYSGVMIYLVCHVKKKHKHGMEVLAAGGRYDEMICNYRNIMEKGSLITKTTPQSAVGISISLDKLIQTLQKEQFLEIYNISCVDCLICSLGSKLLQKEKAKVLKELWAVGIRCALIDAANLEEVDEQCIELNCQHVVLLKESEKGSVIIRSRERDRFHDKKVSWLKMCEYMLEIVNQDNHAEFVSSLSNLSRNESKVLSSEQHESYTNLNIVFETLEKFSSNMKRRHEHQVFKLFYLYLHLCLYSFSR